MNTARENLPDMLQSLIETSPALYLAGSAVPVLFSSPCAKTLERRLTAAVITAAALWYLAGQLLGGPVPHAEASTAHRADLGFTLLLSCLLWVPEGTAAAAGSLFPAQCSRRGSAAGCRVPIGPRCLFLSYVLLLLTAGNLLQAALADVQRPARAATAAPPCSAAGVWVFTCRSISHPPS